MHPMTSGSGPLRVSFVVALAVWTAAAATTVAPQRVHAQEQKSWIPNLPPPDMYGGAKLDPYLKRVAKQRAEDSLGSLTLGLSFNYKSMSAETWQMPSAGTAFDPVPTANFSSLSLSVGALLLHGHVEVLTSVPLLRLASAVGGSDNGQGSRDVGVGYFDLAARVYPWALKPGGVRPYVTLGVAYRTLRAERRAEDANDPTSDVRHLNGWVAPVGVGASYLASAGVLIDASFSLMFGESAATWTGIDPLPLDADVPVFESKTLDLSGMRVTLGVRWVRGLWDETQRERYAEEAAKRLMDLDRMHLLSDLTVSLGVTAPLLRRTGTYVSSRRPYLGDAFAHGLTPQLAVGWHHDPLDAEARLSFRYIYGSAEGYGATTETSDASVFLEVIKKFDLKLYGLVPWVGLGAGYSSLSVTDTHKGGTLTYSDGRPVFTVPFGWDYRVNPSSWWFLRTSFRWIPTAEMDLEDGVTFDHGGFEVDVISFVVHPRRLLAKLRGTRPKADSADAILTGKDTTRGRDHAPPATSPAAPAPSSGSNPEPAPGEPASPQPAPAKPAPPKSAPPTSGPPTPAPPTSAPVPAP